MYLDKHDFAANTIQTYTVRDAIRVDTCLETDMHFTVNWLHPNYSNDGETREKIHDRKIYAYSFYYCETPHKWIIFTFAVNNNLFQLFFNGLFKRFIPTCRVYESR